MTLWKPKTRGSVRQRAVGNWLALMMAALLFAGCSTSGDRAPVQQRGAQKNSGNATRDKDWRPQVYVVQKGDTLFGIAFNHGLDYHEIAQLNNIQNPGMIYVGQELRLFPSAPASQSSPVSQVESPSGIMDSQRGVESRPLDAEPGTAPANAPAPRSNPSGAPIKDQPRAIKLPYSEQAVAQIEKMQNPQKPVPAPVAKVEVKGDSKPIAAAPAAVPPNTGSANSTSRATDEDEGAITWSLPTVGKVIGGFSEGDNRKGIDIAGKLGQAVTASAGGKVVYSGNGLRGYGKLVIIKHNNTYLSAYAHNDKLLVKEGQSVTKGQKIAEMGKTDADQVKLHFEIRKFGKPVDPAKFLPL